MNYSRIKIENAIKLIDDKSKIMIDGRYRSKKIDKEIVFNILEQIKKELS